MGVRVLVGEYDDDLVPAAVMVDSVTGWAFGPLFEGNEAEEQLDAFLSWMRREPWLDDAKREEIGLEPDDLPSPLVGSTGDPCPWPSSGLVRLVGYWRTTELVDGYLPATEDLPMPDEG